MNNKVFLIDIDGTICDDIKNEDSHLYESAEVFPDALETLNKWYHDGAHITFFTAREEKDRLVTALWLRKHKFKYHGLVMGKPRCTDDQEYHWIDNRKVRATQYLTKFTELVTKNIDIEVFDDE